MYRCHGCPSIAQTIERAWRSKDYLGSGCANGKRIQVLRYSALALGVAYGFYHQRNITQHVRSEQAQREYKHKEQLIAQAKAEYAKSKQPASAKTESKAGGRTFYPFLRTRHASLSLFSWREDALYNKWLIH